MCPFVGRKIEAVHALIKRYGAAAPNASPPYIISKVREPQTLDLLRKCTDFRKYVVSTWTSSTLMGVLFRLQCSIGERRQMGRSKRIQTIYQCTMESSHQDTSAQLPSCDVHLALTLGGNCGCVFASAVESRSRILEEFVRRWELLFFATRVVRLCIEWGVRSWHRP